MEMGRIIAFPFRLGSGKAKHMTVNRPAACRHSNMLAVEVPWGCNMAPWLYQYHTLVVRFSNFGMNHRWRCYKILKLLDST